MSLSAPSGSQIPQPHPAQSRAPTALPAPRDIAFLSLHRLVGFLFCFLSSFSGQAICLVGLFRPGQAETSMSQAFPTSACVGLPCPGSARCSSFASRHGTVAIPWANSAGCVPFPEPFLLPAPGWNRNLNFLVNKPRRRPRVVALEQPTVTSRSSWYRNCGSGTGRAKHGPFQPGLVPGQGKAPSSGRAGEDRLLPALFLYVFMCFHMFLYVPICLYIPIHSCMFLHISIYF